MNGRIAGHQGGIQVLNPQIPREFQGDLPLAQLASHLAQKTVSVFPSRKTDKCQDSRSWPFNDRVVLGKPLSVHNL